MPEPRLTKEQAAHLHAVCRNNEANMAKVRAMPLPEADSRQPWVVAEMTLGLLDLLDERDALRDELRNIANAKPSEWEPDVRDQFQQWAQNRARHTLSRAGGGA